MKGPDVKPEYLNGLSNLSPLPMVGTLREQGPDLLVFSSLNAEQALWYKMGVTTY